MKESEDSGMDEATPGGAGRCQETEWRCGRVDSGKGGSRQGVVVAIIRGTKCDWKATIVGGQATQTSQVRLTVFLVPTGTVGGGVSHQQPRRCG